jgi:hypothetical protein
MKYTCIYVHISERIYDAYLYIKSEGEGEKWRGGIRVEDSPSSQEYK